MKWIVDALASEMKIDPVDFRLANEPHPLRQVQWRLGAERIDWKRLRKEYPGSGTKRRGVGCAAAVWFQRGRGNFVVNLLDPGNLRYVNCRIELEVVPHQLFFQLSLM